MCLTQNAKVCNVVYRYEWSQCDFLFSLSLPPCVSRELRSKLHLAPPLSRLALYKSHRRQVGNKVVYRFVFVPVLFNLTPLQLFSFLEQYFTQCLLPSQYALRLFVDNGAFSAVIIYHKCFLVLKPPESSISFVMSMKMFQSWAEAGKGQEARAKGVSIDNFTVLLARWQHS